MRSADGDAFDFEGVRLVVVVAVDEFAEADGDAPDGGGVEVVVRSAGLEGAVPVGEEIEVAEWDDDVLPFGGEG